MRRAIPLFLALAAAAACGGSGDSTPTGPQSVAGIYHLQTINGQALPYIVQQDATGTIEVTDDEFTLNADGTYSEQGHDRVTTATDVLVQAEADVGVYTVTNGAITLTSTVGNGVASGSVSGNTLTTVQNSITAVYKR